MCGLGSENLFSREYNNKVPVVVKVSKSESAMITTDRSELAALLHEKKETKNSTE
jgi:hypothetical protein